MNRTLSTVLGALFVAIGAGAVVAPRFSAPQFGLPSEDRTALAFVRGLGARDVVIGALILTSRDDAPALARIFSWSSLAGLADAAALASVRGLRPQHALHLGGALALALAARSA